MEVALSDVTVDQELDIILRANKLGTSSRHDCPRRARWPGWPTISAAAQAVRQQALWARSALKTGASYARARTFVR